MKTRALLYSLLALFCSLGCNRNPNPGQSQTTQRAANPGTIPIEGSFSEAAFKNLSSAYLLAAANGSPFEKKYARLQRMERQGLPKDFQQALKVLVKYVRTGEGEPAAIKQHTDVL